MERRRSQDVNKDPNQQMKNNLIPKIVDSFALSSFVK